MPIDYKKYHPEWKTISKIVRFVIAGNRCQFCYAKNYKPHPETGSKVILTVAHLDHDISNNELYNLKALCQRCHLSYDFEHHIKNRAENKLKAMQKEGQLSMFPNP